MVATHGHYDEPGLEQALHSSARYIGLVASRKRSEAILKNLRGRGFGDDVLARLKVPAGLDIGAKRGDEIALSIMAEIVQLRRGHEIEATAASEAVAVEPTSTETATTGGCCGGSRLTSMVDFDSLGDPAQQDDRAAKSEFATDGARPC